MIKRYQLDLEDSECHVSFIPEPHGDLCFVEDVEALEKERDELKEARYQATKEIDFAIEFAQARGAITIEILREIKSKIEGGEG
jgi:hypothetical protein